VSWITRIGLIPSHPPSFRYILTLSSHISLALPNGLSLLQVLRLQFCMYFSWRPCVLLTPTISFFFDLVTWMYLLMSTGRDIKEHHCQGTGPQRTDVTLSPSIVLCLSAVWCTCLSYSIITIVISRQTLHVSSTKLHDTNSILCTCQSHFKPLHSATDIRSVSRTNTLTWQMYTFQTLWIEITKFS